MQFQIDTDNIGITISYDEMVNEIKQFTGNQVDFEISQSEIEFRADPTVVVAIVSTAGVIISTLINAFIAVANRHGGQIIILQGKSGARLEVPVDIDPSMLDSLIQKVKLLDAESINVNIE